MIETRDILQVGDEFIGNHKVTKRKRTEKIHKPLTENCRGQFYQLTLDNKNSVLQCDTCGHCAKDY